MAQYEYCPVFLEESRTETFHDEFELVEFLVERLERLRDESGPCDAVILLLRDLSQLGLLQAVRRAPE